MDEAPAGAVPVRRIVGVYAFDGTLRGELLRSRDCSLRQIITRNRQRRTAWRQVASRFSAPFATYHRDDQPDAMRAASGGQEPVVLAETDRDTIVLLDAGALGACDGSVDALLAALRAAANANRLRWPGGHLLAGD
jgi:hypothetical protein